MKRIGLVAAIFILTGLLCLLIYFLLSIQVYLKPHMHALFISGVVLLLMGFLLEHRRLHNRPNS